WKNASGADLQVDTVSVPTLGSTWQKGSKSVVAPTGTSSVSVDLSSSTGVSGNFLYVDQVYVG
ncbi:MAG: hypothetical protein LC799_05700, partial [Actinobacteria bacterium]|nr:hypothetical protein [Actinomycetota bacterium]